MICRHTANDPNCSSNNPYKYETYTVETPDAKNYSILAVESYGNNLALKVKYPNCSRCSYEGTKVLVFLGVSPLEALKWKEIDPHFRDEKTKRENQAPSPAARFPATQKGWLDALDYIRKNK